MMMLYKSGWGTDTHFFPTFKMLPTTQDCPYNEVLFDPQSKILAIVGKEKKQAYRMIPKLDDLGKPIIKIGKNGHTEVQERRLMENFYEYYLEETDDIKVFVEQFAINANTFDWMSFLEEKKETKEEKS